MSWKMFSWNQRIDIIARIDVYEYLKFSVLASRKYKKKKSNKNPPIIFIITGGIGDGYDVQMSSRRDTLYPIYTRACLLFFI